MAIKVLQVLRGSGTYGGVASYLLSRYELIDHGEIHFDFMFCQKKSFGAHSGDAVLQDSYVGELDALKARNYLWDYLLLYKRLKNFLHKNSYNVIHINTGSLPVTFVCLLAAKQSGVKKRISHSHSTNYQNGKLNTLFWLKPLRFVLQNSICKLSTDRLACSEMAARNMFGDGAYVKIENGINISKFNYDYKVRNSIRAKYGCSNKIVIGFVGRLEKSKNIPFIIDIMNELCRNNENYFLWIIGDGTEKEEICRIIDQKSIEDKVNLFGTRTDVGDLMQGMDCLVFPSKYEGLSITVVEAQASGLPVVLSDTLSREHKLTDLVQFVPLNDTSEWVSTISKSVKAIDNDREKYNEEVKAAGYDIADSIAKLVSVYKKVGGQL